MPGSNWPIDRLYGTYPRLVSAYRESIAHLSTEERMALLSGTACATYRL